MAFRISWESLFVQLLLYMSAFSLQIYRQRDSESNGLNLRCCDLNRVRCNSEDVNTSRWLKDGEEYREIKGNSLKISEFQDEGYWSCSLKFANGSVTDWSNAEEVCLSMNVRSEPQKEILVNARLERIQYQYKFNIGKLSHKQKINHIFLYTTIGNGSQTSLLGERLSPSYLLTERISNNGNSIFLSDFSVILNWTKVQSLFINNSLRVVLEIRLEQSRSSINSAAVVTLDCKRKKEHAVGIFLLTFTKGTECAEYEDSQVIKYLLTHTTCLVSDFNVTVLCSNINPQTGIIKISSLWTIQLQSVQAALEMVAMVNLSNINSSFIESPMATTISDMIINTPSRKLFIVMICLLSFSITLLLCLAPLILKKSIKKTKTRRLSLARCEDTSRLREVSISPEPEEAKQEEHHGLRGLLMDENKTKKRRFTATGREAEAVETQQKMSNTLEESTFCHFNQMTENNLLQDN